MKYELIMFDMDGTLLPMDQEEFVNGYFSLLSKKVIEYIKPKEFVDAIWSGVKAMGLSGGLKTNEDAFWDDFCKKTNTDVNIIKPICDDFYGGDFKLAKQFTKDNKLAKQAVYLAKQISEHVVLATNPLFPLIAQETRLSFIGLKKEDFDYITAYEDQRFIKPDTRYYEQILKKYNVKPSECLMIGNDEKEDGYPCSLLGIDCYIVDDCLISSEKHPYSGKRGSFIDLIDYLKELA